MIKIEMESLSMEEEKEIIEKEGFSQSNTHTYEKRKKSVLGIVFLFRIKRSAFFSYITQDFTPFKQKIHSCIKSFFAGSIMESVIFFNIKGYKLMR